MARKTTQQTLENLQRGREKRLENILDRYAQDLTNRYIPKADGDTLSIEAARSKILYVSQEEGVTRRKAYTKLREGRSFTSKEQHFRIVLARNINVNVGFKNRLRHAIYEIEAKEARESNVKEEDIVHYKQTKIDLSKFTVDKHGAYYKGIFLEVNSKADSLSSDLLILHTPDGESYATNLG